MTEERFELIYKDTVKNVLKYIISNCTSMEDVHDLLQETYLDYYRAYIKGKKIDHDDSYLIGIAHKKIKDYYRKKYKWKHLFLSFIMKDNDKEDVELLECVPSDYNLEIDIIQKYELKDFMKYLLKQKQIIIKTFYLYFYFDMTTKEISNELNINESTIKSYIHRTLNDYRKLQKGEQDAK